jgi:ATP-dependent DNA ligase
MSGLTTHEKLWNIDSKGKVRIWYMQTEGGKHRTVSGLFDGKQVTSGWVIVEPKNVGRSNATTAEEQALREVKSDYERKLEKKYYRTLEEAREAGSGMKFFSPMLATKWKDVKDDVEYPVFSQPKLDGIRASFTVEGAISRVGKPFYTVSHISESLSECFKAFSGLRLDGELYNHTLRNDFNKVSSLIKQTKPTLQDLANAEDMVEYHVYDCPSHPGTFSERLKFLNEEVFPLIDSVKIVLVDTVVADDQSDLDNIYGEYLENEYEGQMIRLDMEYLNGPKRDIRLIKRKEFQDEEFEVVAIEEGKGNWAGAAKRVVFKLKTTPDGKIPRAGRYPGAGIKGSRETGIELLKQVRLGRVPKLATIRYPNLTPDGVPRFPVAVAFYDEERDT